MRCAIISDIHGNLDALEAVLADAGTVDQLWCLGDLVGYGPQPNECIAELKRLRALCVAGNHDWAALGRIDTAEFTADASEAVHWTRERLTDEHRSFLEALPEQLNTGPAGEFTLVHGSPRNPVWEYLISVGLAQLNFDYFHTPYCFVGHTHVPRIFQRSLPEEAQPECRLIVPHVQRPVQLDARRTIFNPGSVGQPRDGNAQASYMVYDASAASTHGERGWLILRRVTYSVASVQQKMRDARLPPRLIARLTYGW